MKKTFPCLCLFFGFWIPVVDGVAQNLPVSTPPSVASAISSDDPLTAGFQTPPDSARLWAYWWWLNGNVTEESITRDLEGMKAKGIGGGVLFDANGSSQDGNLRVPAGPMFGTPEWRKLYRHALKEADRLGLSLSLNIQSGWNLGGPFVPPEYAGKHIAFSETTLTGPRRAEIVLPQPRTVNQFYRDVAVLAIPSKKTDLGVSDAKMTVSASSSQEKFPPNRAADGKLDTFWVSGGFDPKNPVTKERPQSLTLTFEKNAAANNITLYGRPGYGPKEWDLSASSDNGKTWKTLVKMNHSFPVEQERFKVSFERTEAKQFRLTFFSAYDSSYPDSPRNVQVTEVALFDGDQPLFTPLQTSPVPLRDFHVKIADREYGDAPVCLPLVLDEPSIPGEKVARISDILALTDKMNADGKLAWDVPEGNWTVLRIGFTQSGSRVSTSSGDWQGYTLDYLSSNAFRWYWEKSVQPLIDDAGPLAGKVLRYLHTDSWEAGGMNWTDDFIAEFQKRRGYDPTPYLPVIAGKILDSREVSNRFLNDYRRTISDCFYDNHYALMQNMAAKYNVGTHPESGGPHGGPFDSLHLLGLSDIPMSEFWSWSPRHRVGDRSRFFLKQPATAAHVYGKRIVAAEGFTNIGMHWQESFSDNLKPSFDQALCEGMNLLVWHAFTCSPKEMGLPGQEYFAGTHFNTNNFTFSKSQDFLGYINRSQFLLQQGIFTADVLEYYGENVPNFTQMKWANTAKSLPGYDYDVATEDAMLHRVSVKDGRIILPDGMNYKVLVLPERNSISEAVLRKLEKWVAEDGLAAIGPKPRRVTGLAGYPESDAEVQKIADKLWGTESPQNSENAAQKSKPTIRKVGKGRVAYGITAHELLQNDRLPFDFERLDGSNPEPRVDSIHRIVYKNQASAIRLKPYAEYSPKDTLTTPIDEQSGVAAHVYFVANLSAKPDATVCAFRVTGLQPELWDALTGEIRPVKAFRQESERTIVPLEFSGYGSIFVVFREPISATQQGTEKTNAPKIEEQFSIDGSWSVSFDPKFGGVEKTTFDKLIFWNQHEDKQIKYYSGAATYRKTANIPKDFMNGAAKSRFVLQLGNVAEIAEVRLNGKTLGTVWAKPYQIDVTDAIREGENSLEIEVVNHWANRVIGDLSLPESERLTKTNIRRLMQQTPLIDAGLSGDVVILRIVK
ncbi:MAG: discoidin domain-containing protein [Planctomycetaceae bacterium]|jgi:hypothetical protein|nr:discoidin domain-containing protein [Planctomycetaceae bacterium]